MKNKIIEFNSERKLQKKIFREKNNNFDKLVIDDCNDPCHNNLYYTFASEDPNFIKVKELLQEDMSEESVIKASNIMSQAGFSREFTAIWINYYMTLISEIGDENLRKLLSKYYEKIKIKDQ
jgi:hypothetical protein